jgi:hypothetical protein
LVSGRIRGPRGSGLAVPFSAIGAVRFIYLLGDDMSGGRAV